MTLRRCAGPCGRDLPLDEANFVLMRAPNGRRTFARTCHGCRTARFVAAGRASNAEIHRAARARAEIRCIGPCGKVKAATDDHFKRRANGVFFNRCRVCERQRFRDYRRTAKYARWRRRLKSRRDKLKRDWERRNRKKVQEIQNRSRQRDTPEAWRARNKLTRAVATGRVRRAEHCEWRACKVGGSYPSGRSRLRAHFARGHAHPLDVKFYCCEHFQRVAAKARETEEERMERADDKAEAKREAVREERRRLARLASRGRLTVAEMRENLRPRKALGERMGAKPEPREPSAAAWAASALTREQILASPWVRAWM